jgi:hypothetical protein
MTKNNVAPLRATDTTHRELSWFSQRVEKGREAPFVEITTVTPAIAARLLEANDGNRPVNDRLVMEIAADIEHGFWRLNGETIIVSREGLLNDGQHRLEAVMRTGTPIQTAIMYGVDRETRMTVDMGKVRSAGNFLSMDGAAHSNNTASVVKTVIDYQHGIIRAGGSGGMAPTKQEIRDFYLKNKKRIDASVAHATSEKFGRVGGVTPIAAAHFILMKQNEAEAAVFFARLFDGANLKANDPILWLRNRLMSERKNWIRATEKLEIILRYWNRWRLGVKMTRQISREGVYPRIEK